jgi:plasmid stabilization system protein ParE
MIWTDDAQIDVKDAYSTLLKRTKSRELAQRITAEIAARARELKANPFVCEEDRFKYNNDGSFRAFEKHTYRVTFEIHEKDKVISIVRVRHAGMEPLEY